MMPLNSPESIMQVATATPIAAADACVLLQDVNPGIAHGCYPNFSPLIPGNADLGTAEPDAVPANDHQPLPDTAQVAFIAHAIIAQLDCCPSLERAAQFLIEEIMQLLQAECGWVAEARDGQWQQIAASGISPELWQQLLPWNHAACACAHPLTRNAGGDPLTDMRNLLILPIVHDGRICGVVGLANCPRPLQPMVYPLIESLLFPLTLRMAHGLREAETSAPFDKLASLQQLDQLKNEFFSIASHELQSPLTVIKGFTEQLLWDLRRQQTTTFEDSLLAIQRQVERLQKLTRDLLDISSCATNQLVLEKREVALSTLVTCVLDELALAHRRTVCREIAPHITLQCDPSRIEQVIRNLVENAFKYSPTTSPVTVRLQQSHDAVKLAVRDEGAGIDAVDLPLVFLPYYRASNTRHAKPGGSGLGLALCKYLVTGHNGAIHVESTPGKGATFTVTLPVG